ncbi:hypothetical protein CDAR_3851 [Caerostris darwini]|uniref:Uncharacterized protein n=1 Tax=Caerostris darwini TaxID=1538125 RepID=A0AAV4RK53_9ARAC|nr:hypothetical protein CDAR_3851 [Caerostris darwini]
MIYVESMATPLTRDCHVGFEFLFGGNFPTKRVKARVLFRFDAIGMKNENLESAIVALSYMKGMRDSKRRYTTAAAAATTVEQTVQSMSAVAAHGVCSAREVSR